MKYLRTFFTSAYGLTLFVVLLLVVAYIALSALLPITIRVEIDRARDRPAEMPDSSAAPPTPWPATVLSAPTTAPTVTPRPTFASTNTPDPTSTPSRTPAPTEILTSTAETPTLAGETPTAPPATVVPTSTVTLAVTATQLLELVNQLRVANGCQPLRIELWLQQAAQAHAEDMRNHR